MTRLRTKWGIDCDEIKSKFGQAYLDYLILQAQSHLDQSHLEIHQNHIHISYEAKFLSDGIAADLFKIEFSFFNLKLR